MKQYKIITYGCQMNVHESEKLAGTLTDLGYIKCDNEEDADVIIFNTCCIRENAEMKAFGNIGALKNLKKNKPSLIIAVCGCMTQAEGNADMLRQKFPFIDIIFGTHNINSFKGLLLRRLENGRHITDIWDKEKDIEENVTFNRTNKINALVNIMCGCNNFCTYCIVPYVRGRERSRPFEEIYNEVKGLVNCGYKEIMLLGQNVNSYGNDLTDGLKFYQLLDKLAQIGGKYRLRFMTSHPKDMDENLIKAVSGNDRICKNIHLPVQSGSDRILQLMNRKYTSWDYLKKIDMIYKNIPDCGITSDIMVGFPGETDEDFNQTVNLVKKAEYSGCYTFIYSKRKGTVAASMENQVPEMIKKQRIMELISIQNQITRRINREKYLNNSFEILVDGMSEKKGDVYCGRTDSGRLVSFENDTDMTGRFVKVKIIKAATASLFGIVNEKI